MKNKWKIAFFSLLGFFLILILLFFIKINMPINEKEIHKEINEMDRSENVALGVAATKEDLNKIINHYLEKEGFTGPLDYQVILKEEVELYGTFPVFGQELQMFLTFEPRALENGDLLLKQNSIQIGTLNLPVSYVLKIIQNHYKLPEWVQIQPSEEAVYISLTELKLKSDIKVKANSFDLKQDDISFTLLVPVD